VTARSNAFATSALKALVERVERLEEQKREIAEDITEVYKEAKGQGFDTKTMRRLVRERRKDDSERAEEQALLDLYMDALGMK
jgi:uncharacterized protein (UPF0335 family)